MQSQFIFAIYKPSGPTSYDIIRQLKKITNIKKIGHAGTLDPLAEGVLVVGITRQGTKQLHQLLKKDKVYLAEIILGAISDTCDVQGELTAVEVKNKPSLAQLKQLLPNFIGKIEQTPPQYSAVKIKGTPAYKLARAGQQFKLQPKLVEIFNIKIMDYKYPRLDLEIHTGSGVYIRSLARDIGAQLKTGGYIKALQRTKVGEFTMKEALTLEQFQEQWQE